MRQRLHPTAIRLADRRTAAPAGIHRPLTGVDDPARRLARVFGC
jgi:hypothetical protein